MGAPWIKKGGGSIIAYVKCLGCVGNSDPHLSGQLLRVPVLHKHQAAQDILSTMPLPRCEVLDTLLEEVIAPVWRLFETIGEALAVPIPEGPGYEV
jgi:hypothetical protein